MAMRHRLLDSKETRNRFETRRKHLTKLEILKIVKSLSMKCFHFHFLFLLPIVFVLVFLQLTRNYLEKKSANLVTVQANAQLAYEIEVQMTRLGKPHPFHQSFPLLKGDSTILCPKGISILFFIHTAPFAFNRRETIRQTWGNKIWQEKFGFKTVFVLGTSKFPDENDQMNREKAQNDDILQFDFIEHYRNLTIKQLSWSRFASQNCRDAKVFVKIDDDVLVNIFWFFKEINVNDFNNTLVCGHECQYHQVWRDKRKPWFVPKEAYEPTLWPRFCSGGLVIESADILPKLVAAVEKRERYISTDDTLFTGILPDELNITKVLASSKFVLNINTTISERMVLKEEAMFGLFSSILAISRTFNELARFYGFIVDEPDEMPRKYDKLH